MFWKKVLKEKTVLKRRKFGQSCSLFFCFVLVDCKECWLRMEMFSGILGGGARLRLEGSFWMRLLMGLPSSCKLLEF
jgi:hypothetical protein